MKKISDSINDFEERADHLTENELLEVTATSEFFSNIERALISKGTKLVVGPRGSGKTHLMRYTYTKCKRDKSLPFCIYISFNKYLRLEPLLNEKPDATDLFRSWVLAKINLALLEWLDDSSSNNKPGKTQITKAGLLGNFTKETIEDLIGKLEIGVNTNRELQSMLSVTKTTEAIDCATRLCGRNRAVVFFDDAAITLTPEYMQELFDIIRSIKTSRIAPKASVYPGTTEYGPRFHVNHEAEELSMWLPITSQDYSTTMGAIAKQRANDIDSISTDVIEYLKYASFGIPRTFLSMIRDFAKKDFTTTQQGLNKIIEKQNSWRKSEYSSLAIKVPKFQSLIITGEALLREIARVLKDSNHSASLRERNEIQLTIGITDIDSPLKERMVNLLVEAGLLYKLNSVSHGQERRYHRFIPHLALLIQEKTFPVQGTKTVSSTLQKKETKHPLRRSLDSLLRNDTNNIKLDIPPCSQCGSPRLSEGQKFCHNCGSALVDKSTFEHCMSLLISDLPNLTNWQKDKIQERKIKTVGDFLALQDPGTELRKAKRIGVKRAEKIFSKISGYVDEFLS
jgi:hypothetical protein